MRNTKAVTRLIIMMSLLPAAVGAQETHGPGFTQKLEGDADSIAGMACGLAGALRGVEQIPVELRAAFKEANWRDFAHIASDFNGTIVEIMNQDRVRWGMREAAAR